LKKNSKLSSLFIIAEQRFRISSDSLLSPGPGKYDIKSALLQKLKKKFKKVKSSSFGTSQKRSIIFEKDPSLLGPCQYEGTVMDTIEQQAVSNKQEMRNAYGRVIPKSSSMFLSSVKRNMRYIKQPY
jgi:hypothetical protein